MAQEVALKKHFNNEESFFPLSGNGFRTGKIWQDCGAIANDDERLVWPAINRIKSCLQDDVLHAPDDARRLLQQIQKRFRYTVQTMTYKQLIDECHINQLLDDYLGLLMIASEADPEAMLCYSAEREYYYTHPQAVKNAALQLQHFIKHYLPSRI